MTKPAGDLGAEHGRQWRADWVGEDDLAPETQRGRRDFRADESRPDYQHPDPRDQGGPHSVGVLRRADHVHTRAVAARDRWPGSPATGGEHHPVGGQRRAIRQLHGRLAGPQPGDGRQVHQADGKVVVPLRGLQRDRLDVLVPLEELLRQRRPVVGELTGVHQGEVAVEATGPQRGDGAHPGDAAPDHHDSAHHQGASFGNRYTSPSRTSTRCGHVLRVAGSP
jgi:hypothetical protein